MVDKIDLTKQLLISWLTYIVGEAVVMVAVLQSLGVDITSYCEKQFYLISISSDPLSNPIYTMGIINSIALILIAYEVQNEKYVLKEDAKNE